MFALNVNYLLMAQDFDYKFWVSIILSIAASLWAFINSKRIEKLKAYNERQIHVHKERFNKEFEIYQGLWMKVHEFESRINSVYNQIKSNVDNLTPEQYKNHSTFERGNYMGPINDSSVKILHAIEIEKPFYDRSVYNKLLILKKFIEKNSLTDSIKWQSKDLKDFLVEESISRSEINEIVEIISESLRQRTSTIEAV